MISYRPFLEFLSLNNIPKTILVERQIISTRTLAKLEKGEVLSLSTIDKICVEFGLLIQNVVEITSESVLSEDYNKTLISTLKEKKFVVSELKQYRKSQKLTQVELAKKIGVEQPLISQWESGSPVPENSSVKLREVLSIPSENIKEI